MPIVGTSEPIERTEATTGIVGLDKRRVPGFKLVSKGFDLKYLIFTCMGQCDVK